MSNNQISDDLLIFLNYNKLLILPFYSDHRVYKVRKRLFYVLFALRSLFS